MSDRTELPSNSQQSSEPKAIDGMRRRRLLKGSLAVAPILMTLTSRPALGAACVTCSKVGSFAHGSDPHTNHSATCSGRTPEDWANTLEWPGGYHAGTRSGAEGVLSRQTLAANSNQTTRFDAGAAEGNKGTLFHEVFPGNQFSGKTLLDLLQTSEVAGYAFVARYLVAALLNASLGVTPVLTESAVQNIWIEYVSNGYFEPTASVKWYDEQIVDYVQSTFG